jgi:hypothetical protein
MQGIWVEDIESLEAISGDADARRLFLRMAELRQTGRIAPFLQELAQDGEIDDATKLGLAELATDGRFLHAVEDYVLRTRRLN